ISSLYFNNSMDYLKETDGFYTIREVSDRTGISSHTLRYWEKVFPEILIPLRTAGGQRRYTMATLDIVGKIFQMVRVEGYSIQGARRKLTKKLRKNSEQIKKRKEISKN
ncbi:MAG: MerR family transcriptional regulator, partial [Patescibacteria group bacterium]|nr:MerR family transcriptional regulator [Patescibacteria group bacterium]